MSSSCHFTSYPFHARRISHLDHVNIKDSDKVRELLHKYGDNYPSPELVEYTTKLNKINKRNKKQLRVFILTTKALYNVKPSSINVLQRRIDIKDIASVTSSLTSLELTIHVPAQYDYRYQATNYPQKNEIIRMISTASHRIQNRHLNIHKIHQSSTSEYTIDRNAAQLLSREERHNRKRALMCREVDINTTIRIKKLPLKLHDILLSDGYVRDEGVYEMDFFIPTSVYPIVFKYFHIPFPLENFTIINEYINGSFAGKMLQVEQNNEYKRGRQYYMVNVVEKYHIKNDEYNKFKIMENKRLLERIGCHPFIQSLCYAFETRKRLFTVFEYCSGLSLQNIMQKHGVFTDKLSKIIIAQICLAIGHLHRYNIFNIDLQPSKFIIDECGFVKLINILPINFNESKNNIKAHVYTVDEISYWAPERLVYKQVIIPAVDWWTIGILLYEFRTGIKPFYSTNINDLKNKIIRGLFVYPRSLGVAMVFKDLVTNLLNGNVNKRIGTGRSDIKNIMRHSYFENIHWFNLKKKEISFPEFGVISNAFAQPDHLSSVSSFNINNVSKDMTSIMKDDQFEFGKKEAFADFTSVP